MASPAPPTLPTEIILLIIEALDRRNTVALPAKHIVTKTLLSFCLTAKCTYGTAVRVLLSRCLYIDSASRLRRLLHSLGLLSARLRGDEQSVASLPPQPVLPYMQSLYLSPQPHHDLEPYQVLSDVCDLVLLLGPSLRRLVIDIQIHAGHFEDETRCVQPSLRRSFAQLFNMEELCSVRDSLFVVDAATSIPYEERALWSPLQKLRALALYKPHLDGNFYSCLANLPNLRTLVTTQSTGLSYHIPMRSLTLFWKASPHQLTISFVNTWMEHNEPAEEHGWKAHVDDRITLKQVFVPTSYYGDEDMAVACRDWTMRKALDGELERLGGSIIQL
jgi:hypothetical protein